MRPALKSILMHILLPLEFYAQKTLVKTSKKGVAHSSDQLEMHVC